MDEPGETVSLILLKSSVTDIRDGTSMRPIRTGAFSALNMEKESMNTIANENIFDIKK
jgi:hypothetical protein